MFTGLVQQLGTVVRSDASDQLRVRSDLRASQGDSISVDGCCLTVADHDDDVLVFDVMPVTLRRTRAGSYDDGALVNLEPALRMGDPLGGHLVQGHVDGVATVAAVGRQGNARLLSVELEDELVRYCVARGSVALNGASLTVADLRQNTVTVSLVPETVERTNLGQLAERDVVNVEVDLLAKYVERLLVPWAGAVPGSASI